jgi:hypothetical protein
MLIFQNIIVRIKSYNLFPVGIEVSPFQDTSSSVANLSNISKLNRVFSQFALFALSGPYVEPVKSCDSLLCAYCNTFHLVQSFFIPDEKMSLKQQPNP